MNDAHPTTITRYLAAWQEVVLVNRPADLDATATEHATLAALDEIVCTDASCLQAISHISLCECRGCRGADHGKQQDRAGLMPVTVTVDQAARRARNVAAVFAASADLDDEF